MSDANARVVIRPARPGEDDAAIWDILRPAVEAGDVFCAPRDGGMAGALAYWRPPGATNFLAELDGDIVGTSYLRANQAGGGSHVANAGYCTRPDVAGRGVAQALLRHSLDEARARGFRAMQYNFVVATNRRAIETWLRAGFRVVGELPGAFRHPVEGHVDAYVMWKDLADGD
ncbi:GNAT family N-acetyltransferase [Roseibacterium sp. SDUM158016]|uniref:GNAT family N-acetyltransferase n=1 Tax=Roseicyclus sediminis TaxID=2980997 RepID=UPI0021CFF5B1|nr:GNAT family N-acetyltransferase [Roseibacterium sp. SDUM158016]MCU4652352.1 GNAT family N-acetyltransferase [Roseibacterium sp. SDUM158016]